MDYTESSQDTCVITLLDWEEAFDKVDKKRMVKALSRFGSPSKLCNIIDSLYKDLKFKVHDQHSSSNIKRQCAGIRQGCPLLCFF